MGLKKLCGKHLFIGEILVIVGTALIPLFVTIPYRINIYLTWEGAYRLYEGQVPFKDFGLPMGYAFWIIPSIFFSLFGPFMYSLLKAQVFINIISGLTFSGILRAMKVPPAIKFIAVFLFCLSYSLLNIWPWYNHTVFVFEIIAIYFVLQALLKPEGNYSYLFIGLAALFSFLSFFTKQDGGALAIALISALIVYQSITDKNIKLLSAYFLSLIGISGIFILPALQHNFLYWFNIGQPPHYSRVNLMDFLHEIFKFSQWEKFYIILVIMLLVQNFKSIKEFFSTENKTKALFILLTLGILVQALLVQVTSYIPHDVNIYFHSFAIAFILSNLNLNLNFEKPAVFALVLILIMFWYSKDYWQYARRVIVNVIPSLELTDNPEVVSKHTWNQLELESDTLSTGEEAWVYSDMPSFQKITMPSQTKAGINRLKQLSVFDEADPKILNMSELTPLAYELDFDLGTGPEIPLWYHKNVAIFDREIADYCSKIENHHYDLVLFEVIPFLNNFYPDEVRECLQNNYELIDSFLAPRQIQNSQIEIYLKPKK